MGAVALLMATGGDLIEQPTITSPTGGTTDLAVSFTATTTSALVAHAESDWQIATDSGFTNVISSTSNDTTNRTTWTGPASYNGILYARVRFKNNAYSVISKWSNTVSFTPSASITANETVTTGSNYTASVTSGVPAGPTYTYTWKKNGSIIGTNSSSLSHQVYMYDHGKVVTCDVQVAGCSTAYTITRPGLTLQTNVVINTSGGATVTAGSNWTGSVTSVTGTPYPSFNTSYQWLFNGGNFNTGGTGTSVSFKSFYSDNGKIVKVRVTHTDTSGSAQSTFKDYDFTMSVNRGAAGPYGGPAQYTQGHDAQNFGPVGQWNNLIAYTVPASWWNLSSVRCVNGAFRGENTDPGRPANETINSVMRVGHNASGTSTYYTNSGTMASQTTNYSAAWSSSQTWTHTDQVSQYNTTQKTLTVYMEGQRPSDPNKSAFFRGTLEVNGTLLGYLDDTRSSSP